MRKWRNSEMAKWEKEAVSEEARKREMRKWRNSEMGRGEKRCRMSDVGLRYEGNGEMGRGEWRKPMDQGGRAYSISSFRRRPESRQSGSEELCGHRISDV